METRYPTGTIATLLMTDFVSPKTRHVMEQRMAKAKSSKPLFFSAADFEMLSVICDLLVAQDFNNRFANIAIFIDERLNDNTCDGWRYNEMPPDGQMYLQGLSAINDVAQHRFEMPFTTLDESQQSDILESLQSGTVEGPIWKVMPPQLFFEELLAEATEIFYSFPAALEEIGYVGMADAKGWTKIGLNESDKIEPLVISNNQL